MGDCFVDQMTEFYVILWLDIFHGKTVVFSIIQYNGIYQSTMLPSVIMLLDSNTTFLNMNINQVFNCFGRLVIVSDGRFHYIV